MFIFRLLYNLRERWNLKEEEELRKWKKNMELLSQKGKEYQDRIIKLEVIIKRKLARKLKSFLISYI
jgi:hypothetical protein